MAQIARGALGAGQFHVNSMPMPSLGAPLDFAAEHSASPDYSCASTFPDPTLSRVFSLGDPFTPPSALAPSCYSAKYLNSLFLRAITYPGSVGTAEFCGRRGKPTALFWHFS